jgi:hypothetical protein
MLPMHDIAPLIRAARAVARILKRAGMIGHAETVTDLCQTVSGLRKRVQELEEERDAMWLRLHDEQPNERTAPCGE